MITFVLDNDLTDETGAPIVYLIESGMIRIACANKAWIT